MTDRRILRIIGQNIRNARLRANLTQECVAELIGVHWQTINHIENGKYPSSVVKFTRLSQALEVSPNRLLEGVPPPDKKQAERIKKALARKRRPKLD